MSNPSLSDWLAGASLPERTATVYANGKAYADFQVLEQELLAARQAPEDDRLAGGPRPAIVIADEMERLREAMKSSAMTFRFRAVPRKKSREIVAAAPKMGKDEQGEDLFDADYIAVHTVAAASVEPKLAVEDVEAIREAVGDAQFDLLFSAARAVSTQGVDVPFSLAASSVRNTRDSSGS